MNSGLFTIMPILFGVTFCLVFIVILVGIVSAVIKTHKAGDNVNNITYENNNTIESENNNVVECKYCGAINKADNVECKKCGAPLKLKKTTKK